MTVEACLAPPEMVDVAFDLAAPCLPPDYEWPLYRALARVAPWIESVHAVGVHPLRATQSADGSWLLARRAKLVVRLPRDRVCAASILEGATLDLGAGVAVALGHGILRTLEAAPTVYSPRVATGDDDEAAFAAHVREELEALGIRRPIVCGKRSRVILDGGSATAFGLAVHGLGDAASLLLQRAGIGRGRAIGCGIFVPHKTIVAAE
ncbi:MAG TPA: type I-MYXAN CRISPR-associated protein Cas6/Cmx6 [Usitatibacter sp.]|nr:type I-MYXAN CRISPR-associated protein Cas6/Cmx6 [Usitatibacter sp.]